MTDLKYGECPKCHRALTENHDCSILHVDKTVIKGIADAFMLRIRKLEAEIKHQNSR